MGATLRSPHGRAAGENDEVVFEGRTGRSGASLAVPFVTGESHVTRPQGGMTMAGTIDSAIERKRDKDPGHVAEKQRKLESDADRRDAERKQPHESPRETPKTD